MRSFQSYNHYAPLTVVAIVSTNPCHSLALYVNTLWHCEADLSEVNVCVALPIKFQLSELNVSLWSTVICQIMYWALIGSGASIFGD